MIIERVRAKNYKTYQELDLDLSVRPDRPIVLVGGHNGDGKTTLFEAIYGGLYGLAVQDRAKCRELVNVKPPTTLAEVVTFLNMASRKHDLHTPRQGVKIVLKTVEGAAVPAVPRIRANNISVYDALKLVTRITGYDFRVEDETVVIFENVVSGCR